MIIHSQLLPQLSPQPQPPLPNPPKPQLPPLFPHPPQKNKRIIIQIQLPHPPLLLLFVLHPHPQPVAVKSLIYKPPNFVLYALYYVVKLVNVSPFIKIFLNKKLYIWTKCLNIFQDIVK